MTSLKEMGESEARMVGALDRKLFIFFMPEQETACNKICRPFLNSFTEIV